MTTTRPVQDSRAGRWVARHRFIAFVALAYAISWSLWLGAAAGGGQALFLLGGLGPMAAAAIVTAVSGGSLIAWIRPVWRWRVPARPGGHAPGPPPLLLRGAPPPLVFVLFLGGAMEEPGWRGFGLPVLQERYSPLRATIVLGLVWGVWHVPIYGPAGFVVPWVLAVFYTLLWNATHSVGLCILLHASFTPAQDHLLLMPRQDAYTAVLDTPDWVILGTYLVAAGVVVAMTRGRLGAGLPR